MQDAFGIDDHGVDARQGFDQTESPVHAGWPPIVDVFVAGQRIEKTSFLPS